MIDYPSTWTLSEWEERVGVGVRQFRIAAGFDQIELAERANISRSAVQSLERGEGSRLRTLIAVLRALDRLDALDALMPDAEPTPLEVLADARRASLPQRVRRTGT